MADTDSTLVTGAPLGGRAPRRGDVLGERYEIVAVLDSDSLAVTHRALDQETNRTVLLRSLVPGLLGEKDARRLVERLKPLVGHGGRVLAPVRDVDREGALAFTVEAWPEGTSLRAVLDARRAKGQPLRPEELLPVVARLAAAIASIPEPTYHGDVRPQRVWVRPDGLALTGGFLLGALPGDVLEGALRGDVALRRQFAPEVGEGMGGRPSDRFAVAAICWEALTGKWPEPGPKVAPPQAGAAGEVLVRFLHPDPASRPASLDSLVAALAQAAGLPVPRVDVEPIPALPATGNEEPTALVESDEGDHLSTSEMAAPATDPGSMPDAVRTDPGLGEPEGGEPGGNDTQRLAAVDEQGRPVRDLSDIDPGLLRAAKAAQTISHSGTFELDSDEIEPVTGAHRMNVQTTPAPPPDFGTKPASTLDDLDPRLVRAALGISMDESQPRAKPLPVERAMPKAADGAPPLAKKPPGVTQELSPLDLEPVGAPSAPTTPISARPPARKAPVRTRPVVEPAPVPLPTDIKPIPRVRAPSGESLPAVGPVLFDDGRPRSNPPPPVAPPPAAMAAPAPMVAHVPAAYAEALRAEQPMRPLPPANMPPATQPAMRAASTGPSRSALGSRLVIAGALILAMVILGLAFWYRNAQEYEARERQIQQRLRELSHSP